MKLLIKPYLLLFLLATNCSVAQEREINAINIDELYVGNINIVQEIDSVNDNGYYKYIDKKSIVDEFGLPDEIQAG